MAHRRRSQPPRGGVGRAECAIRTDFFSNLARKVGLGGAPQTTASAPPPPAAAKPKAIEARRTEPTAGEIEAAETKQAAAKPAAETVGDG